jgi:hypothetical protein
MFWTPSRIVSAFNRLRGTSSGKFTIKFNKNLKPWELTVKGNFDTSGANSGAKKPAGTSPAGVRCEEDGENLELEREVEVRSLNTYVGEKSISVSVDFPLFVPDLESCIHVPTHGRCYTCCQVPRRKTETAKIHPAKAPFQKRLEPREIARVLGVVP